MILYRPVGLQELALIYDSGMKAFPARLPQQPIFYPVLDLEYARKTASDWNVKNGQLAGYVTEFKVEDQYISHFEKHTVTGSQYEELWIPAEEVEEFNKHITGHIKVLEAHFGDGFQGFVPDKFGLQGKDAVEQFNVLANSYLYKRMDFYLEIKRNHKAVFLNYPFWQKYDFKNPGLKSKVAQAIKEAWLTSFPKIPLPLPPPVPEDTPLVKQTPARHLGDPDHEHIAPVEQTHTRPNSLVDPVDEEITLEEETDSDSWVDPVQEEMTPRNPTLAGSHGAAPPLHEDNTPEEKTNARVNSQENHVKEEPAPIKQPDAPGREHKITPTQTHSHFAQGLKLAFREKYTEAIDELSRAIKEDPDDVTAQTSLGVAFHRQGEDERALACYETALKIDPIYAEAHYFRANLLYRRGNVREAITGYTIAVGLKPELIDAHQTPEPQDRLTDYTSVPAEMYWIAKPAHRILELNNLLESHRGQVNLLKERAAAYYRLRNYAQAIADYSAALAIQPHDGGALHSRGLAYEQLGQHERALQDYQQAIASNPQLSNVYINRGVMFGNTGNFRQSIASLTEAIRLAPKSPDGYFNRGIAYFQQGNLEGAIEDFSNVIRLSPKDEDAYYWRGFSNEGVGRQQEAIDDYRQFLAISQNSEARAEIEQRLRQWDEGKQSVTGGRGVVPVDRQTANQSPSQRPDRELDLYGLVVALGERAIHSIWFGSGVECYGEKAEKLYTSTDQDKPIQGRDFLSIASGIRQTIQGDFQAFDPGAASPWIFIRAWGGSGFYVETNDPKIKERLRSHFPSMEEVEGASPPYEALFIRL